MFLYKKRDILAGIITLLMLLGSTSSAAASTQTDISQPVYECPGEPVANLNGALGDEFTQYTEDTTGDRRYSRYFSFQTQVDGDIKININKNNTKQEIDIGSSCEDTQIYNGRRDTTNYSGNFPVSSGTTYYVRIRERNRDNHINFTTTFDFTAPIVEPTSEPEPEPTPVPEPVPTEPIVTEPIVTEPAPTEPIVTEPVPAEPIVTEPVPAEPIVTEPIPEPTPEPQVPACQSGPAQQLGQIKDSISGAGLVDVTVTIAGCSTQTDADGYYTLNNIVENDEAVVSFEKEGYLLGSTKIQIKELSGENTASSNYLEYALYAHDYNWNLDSTEEILSSRISIDASVAYIDTDGNPYSGTITAELTILDPGEEALLPAFPGGFKGINTNGEMIQFESYGLISLSLKDSNNNTLSLADNEIATLVFKSMSSTEEQTTIPLWYYDYDQGTWVEEGYAELQGDGTFKGEISHLGIWSLNKPVESTPGIYIDRILYPDGTPVKNLRIKAIGENWIKTDLSTDENGIFEIEVIPGKEFTLQAYHYTDKYSAVYNGMISAIASGDIVDDRI